MEVKEIIGYMVLFYCFSLYLCGFVFYIYVLKERWVYCLIYLFFFVCLFVINIFFIFFLGIILQMFEILIYILYRYVIQWDLFLYYVYINFLLNVDFVYFVYLYLSGGIFSKYWFIYILLFELKVQFSLVFGDVLMSLIELNYLFYLQQFNKFILFLMLRKIGKGSLFLLMEIQLN